MKIIRNKYIPFGRFKAVNIFGIIFVKTDTKLSSSLINHEAIHTAQMKELLFIFFYILWALNWLFNIIYYWFDFKKAYRMIVFEQEAFEYQSYPLHIECRSIFFWLKYIF